MMRRPGVSRPAVVVASLGPKPPWTATFEALTALSSCPVIMCEEPRAIPTEVRSMLKGRFLRWEPRSARRLLASKRSLGVLIGVGGSELRGIGTFLATCRRAGTAVNAFASISAFDIALAERGVVLGHDIQGLQCLDASYGKERKTWDIGMPVLLRFRRGLSAGRWSHALGSLEAFYPKGHPFWLLRPRALESIRLLFQAGAPLPAAPSPGDCLYIPALAHADTGSQGLR